MKITIEEQLKAEGQGIFQTVGISMEPLLHQRESTVLISNQQSEYKKNDVVLFRRPSDEYVLHRIIRYMGNDTYFIRGDNCLEGEIVPEDWILGCMIGWYPHMTEEYYDCDNPEYLRYVKRLKFIYCKKRIRHFGGKIIRKVKRVGKRMMGRR